MSWLKILREWCPYLTNQMHLSYWEWFMFLSAISQNIYFYIFFIKYCWWTNTYSITWSAGGNKFKYCLRSPVINRISALIPQNPDFVADWLFTSIHKYLTIQDGLHLVLQMPCYIKYLIVTLSYMVSWFCLLLKLLMSLEKHITSSKACLFKLFGFVHYSVYSCM